MNNNRGVIPPATLAGLKELATNIASGKADIHLGGRTLRVLAEMVRDPHLTAVLPISKLAENHQVNPSTLTRMSQRLGFPGFSALQQIFRQHVSSRGGFYSGRASRLTSDSDQDPTRQLIQRMGKEELNNITAMIEELDPAAIESAAEIIAGAPRVCIYGARQSAAVASFMAYALGMLRNDAALLESQQQGVAHGLAKLAAGDALVLIGSSPYTRATVAAARVADEQGIQLIAFTDTLASPLARVADHIFIMPTSGSFYSNCMASSSVLVEILLSVVARRLQERAVSALNRHEEMINALDVQI